MYSRVLKIAIVAAMAITIVALSVANILLRQHLRAALHSAAAPHQGPYLVGDTLPQFSVRDRSNKLTRIGGPSSAETVFVFFLPGCNPCEEALGAVAAHPYPNTAVVSVLSPQLSAADIAKLPPTVAAYTVEDFGHSPIHSRARTVPQILRVNTQGSIVAVCAAYESCVPRQ